MFEMIVATKSSVPILGQIASILGWIMDGIFRVLDGVFGIQNIGLCIIIFTIIIYVLMTPLQIKQQKFSKMSSVMQPELQKIQKKYQGKTDQDSRLRMNEEMQLVYQKYGVSPTGSCVQLLIQFPILMSLWQVIYKIPAYVGSVKEVFTTVVGQITSVNGYTDIIQDFISDNKITRVQLVLDNGKASSDSVIDFLYALSPSQWDKLADIKEFSGFSNAIDSTASEISKMQTFGVLNIADQPWEVIKTAIAAGTILIAVCAILVPLLSWATQMINIKLMPTAQQSNDKENTMANSMRTMNTVMPLMSAFFCFTFPVGLGIYWISGSVVRSIQQLIINRHMNKIDLQDLIDENMKKLEKKREKAGLPPQKITNQAHQNVRNINPNQGKNDQKLEEAYKNASKAKPGSITAKANMVRDFDERNKKNK